MVAILHSFYSSSALEPHSIWIHWISYTRSQLQNSTFQGNTTAYQVVHCILAYSMCGCMHPCRWAQCVGGQTEEGCYVQPFSFLIHLLFLLYALCIMCSWFFTSKERRIILQFYNLIQFNAEILQPTTSNRYRVTTNLSLFMLMPLCPRL